MTLISVVLSPKDAYSSNALPLRSPTPPGKAVYLRVAPGWPWSTAACERSFFPPQKGISASSVSGRTVPCCRGSFYPVFSSLSGVTIHRAVVSLLCPWEEVSSESAYATILTPSPENVFFKVKMKHRHLGLPLFWQSKSSRNVFHLILLSRISLVIDFPAWPLQFKKSPLSNWIPHHMLTLFYTITDKLVTLPVFEHVQWQVSPKRAYVIFKFSIEIHTGVSWSLSAYNVTQWSVFSLALSLSLGS